MTIQVLYLTLFWICKKKKNAEWTKTAYDLEKADKIYRYDMYIVICIRQIWKETERIPPPKNDDILQYMEPASRRHIHATWIEYVQY